MKYVLNQKGECSEEAKARAAIKPGMTIYGYCRGLFGRDSYGEKTVLHIYDDYVEVKEDGHYVNSLEINGHVYSWVGLIEDSNKALKVIWR